MSSSLPGLLVDAVFVQDVSSACPCMITLLCVPGRYRPCSLTVYMCNGNRPRYPRAQQPRPRTHARSIFANPQRLGEGREEVLATRNVEASWPESRCHQQLRDNDSGLRQRRVLQTEVSGGQRVGRVWDKHVMVLAVR